MPLDTQEGFDDKQYRQLLEEWIKKYPTDSVNLTMPSCRICLMKPQTITINLLNCMTE
jgi:hypothetical protein